MYGQKVTPRKGNMVAVQSKLFPFKGEAIRLGYTYNFGNCSSDYRNPNELFVVRYVRRGKSKFKFCCVKATDVRLSDPIIHRFREDELEKTPWYELPNHLIKRDPEEPVVRMRPTIFQTIVGSMFVNSAGEQIHHRETTPYPSYTPMTEPIAQFTVDYGYEPGDDDDDDDDDCEF